MKRYPFLDLTDANSPYIEELVAAAQRVVRSGRYIGGPEVEAFEDKLARMTCTAQAVGVSNGLDALRLILRAYIELGQLRPDDEVLVPANTYIASFLAISDAGLKPIAVDVDPATALINPAQAVACITPRTRALMTVHLYGRVAWNEDLAVMAQNHNLIVIEDNAQAIGAVSAIPGPTGGFTTGSLGHAAAFSFYPTKNIGALGDAGAVTTDDATLANTVRALANYGADRRYHNIYRGFNCRLDPLQAAMLSVKLDHTADENIKRRHRAMIYREVIVNPLVSLPPFSDDGRDCVWHQFVITCPKRDKLRRWLASNGVETDIHYAVPPHLQPCYSNLRHGPLPVTEQLASTIISLPIGNSTSCEDVREIGHIINQFNPTTITND